MNNIKQYLISLGITFLVTLVLSLILSTINYFTNMSLSLNQIIKIIIPILSIASGGIYLGINTKEKGYIEGLKLGIVYVIIVILLDVLGFNNFHFINILKYVIFIVTASLSAIFGINLKDKYLNKPA